MFETFGGKILDNFCDLRDEVDDLSCVHYLRFREDELGLYLSIAI
jgi:hypothetical protein